MPKAAHGAHIHTVENMWTGWQAVSVKDTEHGTDNCHFVRGCQPTVCDRRKATVN